MYAEFLGEPADFWAGLKKEMVTRDTLDLHKEIVELSSKVYFYEKHLNEMAKFRSVAESPRNNNHANS